MNAANYIKSLLTSLRCHPVSLITISFLLMMSCKDEKPVATLGSSKTAQEILGDPAYRAISYGGYRMSSRDHQPSVEELKEDMLLLSALGIKLIRTYNVKLAHAGNVLQAIKELKEEDARFEMYVMLGAWIDCKYAWTGQEPDHDQESEANEAEIARAVELSKAYPDIVKIIAVGNEAMVKWATSYYVQPDVILKWVQHLQDLKETGELSKSLWITSSDNFASWGGGDSIYHVPALNQLMEAVDFISLHTYPMHDTHYNPDFWDLASGPSNHSDSLIIANAMDASLKYAQNQFQSVANYMRSIGVNKPLQIGETGWASSSDGHYGNEGSRACDEYKQALYHDAIRAWTDEAGISCFFFEAFDEQWKDAQNPKGSENHFGLFTIDGAAKFVLWDEVDQGLFNNLGRGGKAITKTHQGLIDTLMKTVLIPSQKLAE